MDAYRQCGRYADVAYLISMNHCSSVTYGYKLPHDIVDMMSEEDSETYIRSNTRLILAKLIVKPN